MMILTVPFNEETKAKEKKEEEVGEQRKQPKYSRQNPNTAFLVRPSSVILRIHQSTQSTVTSGSYSAKLEFVSLTI